MSRKTSWLAEIARSTFGSVIANEKAEQEINLSDFLSVLKLKISPEFASKIQEKCTTDREKRNNKLRIVY